MKTCCVCARFWCVDATRASDIGFSDGPELEIVCCTMCMCQPQLRGDVGIRQRQHDGPTRHDP